MADVIMVVEDEDNIRANVAEFLQTEGYDTILAKDGEEALRFFEQQQPDLVILDLMLPKINGYEVCTDIRRYSNVPVVILTARDGELDELKGFNCGADEYIAKPFSPNILMARIKSLLKRCELLMEETVTIDDFTIDSRQRTVYLGTQRIILTPKEFDLIYYLVNNKNLALSREQILDAVWGIDYYGDTRTVDTHIKCIRAKLGDFGEHIKTIRKFGYKMEI